MCIKNDGAVCAGVGSGRDRYGEKNDGHKSPLLLGGGCVRPRRTRNKGAFGQPPAGAVTIQLI